MIITAYEIHFTYLNQISQLGVEFHFHFSEEETKGQGRF